VRLADYIPPRIKIAGKWWAVEFLDRDDMNALCPMRGHNIHGFCDGDERSISLWDGLRGRRLCRAIIHEGLHAVCFATGFKLSHRQIYQLDVLLGDALWDNFLKAGFKC